MVDVLRLGLGSTDAEAKGLGAALFRTGLDAGLQVAVADYVFRLFHNGKSADEMAAENTGTEGEPAKGTEAAEDGEADPLSA